MLRGVLFDAAALVANTVAALWLVERLAEGPTDGPGPRALVVAALLAQAAGALLKGPALGERRGPTPFGSLPSVLIANALLLNLAISAVLLLGTRTPAWVLPLALVSTACVGAACLPQRAPAACDRGAVARKQGRLLPETAGDALLWFNAEIVLVLFSAFLAPLVTWRQAGPHLRDEVPLWAAVAAATLFQTLFFYAPFRLLQLVEDARRPATWVLMALAVLPLQWQVVRSWMAVPLRLSCSPRSLVLRGNAVAETTCQVTAGPRFSGSVSFQCVLPGDEPIACAASPPAAALLTGGTASVRFTLSRRVAGWPGPVPVQVAVLAWAGGAGAERDFPLWVTVDPVVPVRSPP